ncbi:MAG: CNNM domain-containing protein, partial [Pseudomonadota bacterium]|nr:CNNM domain-containing protein [Pseudomonadota bacterium]
MSQSEMGLWLTGGFIVILLILSAFLSGSETALTATSRARMLRMQQEGSRRAGWVAYLLDQHERLLGAILLGNNLVNILASVLATSVFLRLFGETGVVYATLMMTVLVVVFAEVLPKTYAIQTPDQTALRAAGLLRILVGVLAPFTKLLQLISRTILRAAGFTGASAGSLLPAHEELRGAIDLHHKEGGVRKRDRDMLGGILDLGDTQVDEVMVHRKSMLMIDADLTPAEIVKQALDSPYTRIPLWSSEPENIIGVLHAKDLLRALAASNGGSKTLDIRQLATPPWFVPETTLLIEQLNAFRTRKAHFALVVDEYG